MARRRLSQQQQRRIQAAQQAHSDNHQHARGLVVSHQGKQLVVQLEDGDRVECKIKSNLGAIVCGDRVSIETVAEEHRVAAVIERDNLLQRVDGFGHARPVAANIGQLVVCLAYSPEPNLFLLDQYLLSAEQQDIDACVLINKCDLAGERHAAPAGGIGNYRCHGFKRS